MDWTKQITKAIDKTPESETETLRLLQAARAAVLASSEESNYEQGVHDVPIVEVQDEQVAEELFTLQTLYSFVDTFSYLEFKCFSKVVQANQESASNIKRKRGRPKKTFENAVAERENDCQIIREKFLGLRHNRLTDEYQFQKIDKSTGKLYWYTTQGDDLNQLSITLAVEHGENVPLQRAKEAFLYVARQNPYEPQVELMEYCRKQYPNMTVTEARDFMSTIGERLLGHIEDEPVICGEQLRNRFFSRFFIAMAFLARHPGETLQWMPILIGSQGCGKSQLCTHIIPSKFADLFQQVTLSIETLKKEPFQLHSGFLIEMPEIDANMRGSKSIEPMKNLITTRIDLCRKPYAMQQQRMVRRFGLMGTTNRSDLFQDGTGERRYMPLNIPNGFELPWREMRDGLNVQIWAAADLLAQQYSGNEIELKGFTKEEHVALAEWQGNFSQIDPWETKLLNFVRLRSEFTVDEALTEIGVDPSRQDLSSSRRLTNLIEKLFGDKAVRRQLRRNGLKKYFWCVTGIPPLISESGDGESIEVTDLKEYIKNTIGSDF